MFSPTLIMLTNSGLNTLGWLPSDAAMAVPPSRSLRRVCSTSRKYGLRVDSARPPMARMIGTPALLRLYICRQKMISSSSSTRSRPSSLFSWRRMS
ncbi:hypothetical protein D3C78_733230 [compost metagenome]